MSVALLITSTLLVVSCGLAFIPVHRVDYRGYKVYELLASDQDQYVYLKALQDNPELDFWLEATGPGYPAHVLVPPNLHEQLQEEFSMLNTTVVVDDVARLLDRERESMKFSRSRRRDDADKSGASQSVHKYMSFGEVTNFIFRLETQYPDIVTIEYLTDDSRIAVHTHEDRKIPMVKVGRPGHHKPAVWVDGGIHAREWISVAVAVHVLNELVSKYGRDDQITRYVDEIDWYIVSVANPDGYINSWEYDRVWRKNMNRNSGRRCWGVDLNRNFDWHWGTHSTAHDECQAMYGGTGPASEPETVGFQATVTRLSGRLVGMFSLHSYAQLWLYPFCHKKFRPAPDWTELEEIAYESLNTLGSIYGTKYRTGTAASTLYSASGTSLDWAKGVARVKFAYLIELRPEMNRFFTYQGFNLPESEIGPTAIETFAGMKVVADKILQIYE